MVTMVTKSYHETQLTVGDACPLILSWFTSQWRETVEEKGQKTVYYSYE
jgi:hypothetical protein